MAITFIGSASGSAINGANATINVGGVTGIADGDFLIVMTGTFARAAGNGLVTTNGTGNFTEPVNATSTNFRGRVACKFRTGDTTLTMAGSANTADAVAGLCMVFRGVDPVAPLDVAAVSATGSSANPDPPAIIPVTDHAFIVAMAASMVRDTSWSGTVTNYLPATPVGVASAAETNASTVAGMYRDLAVAALENPAAFTSWSSGTWVAATLALNPRDMATYVYNVADGSLFTWGLGNSIGQVIVRPTPLFNYGLAFKTGLLPLDATHAWDAATKSVIVVTAKVRTGLPPDLTDYPANIAATGYVLQAPTDATSFNIALWAQPNMHAFHDFCVLQPAGWDKSLHSQLWIYLQA